MENYVSLIVDIEKSRMYGIDERNEMQNYMFYCIERLNQLFTESMEYEVAFSAGDELQGLFLDATTAVLYFRLLEMLLKPVKLRAGIGVGAWTVKVKNGLSTQQDGPAYHKARKAIEEVHKKQLHNIRIISDDNDAMANHLINASYNLKNQQIYMQNIVYVIVELLYPFATKRMNLNKYGIVKDLLGIKFEYGIGRRSLSYHSKRDVLRQYAFNYPEIPYADPVLIDGNLDGIEDEITRKNMAVTIANILNCSRQNVETIIKRGNTNKIRELDYVALQYIEKEYQ